MSNKNNKKEIIHDSIIATIGPSCNSKNKLLELKKAGVTIFRVNMSHSSIGDLKKYAELGFENDIKIGLDTEGAQIRTILNSTKSIFLEQNNLLKIYKNIEDAGINQGLSFYPEESFNKIEEGCLIRIDFNGACVLVQKKSKSFFQCKCFSSGLIENNKGVDILNHKIKLPDFTEKDLRSFELIKELKINEVFISFCKSRKAIYKLKSISENINVTSKIECKESIHNLYEICEASDAILIDRGDLTREINIMDIPFAQRGIIKVSNLLSKPCLVATNVFESLIKGNLPTRSELNDVVNTLEMGAAGIVLAAETAIGNKPLLSVEIVKELMHRYRLFKNNLLFADVERNEITDSDMKLWLNRINN